MEGFIKMTDTKVIIYCLEEVIKDLVREELEINCVKPEIIEKVVKKEKCVLFENYEKIVAEFMNDLTLIPGPEILENLKEDYLLDDDFEEDYLLNDSIKKAFIYKIMNWVTRYGYLDDLIKIYEKKEKIENIPNDNLKIYESLSKQMSCWKDSLKEYGYNNKRLGFSDGYGYLVVIVKFIELFGNWTDVKKEIAKSRLLGKSNPFRGYFKKIGREDYFALFKLFLEKEENKEEIFEILENTGVEKW